MEEPGPGGRGALIWCFLSPALSISHPSSKHYSCHLTCPPRELLAFQLLQQSRNKERSIFTSAPVPFGAVFITPGTLRRCCSAAPPPGGGRGSPSAPGPSRGSGTSQGIPIDPLKSSPGHPHRAGTAGNPPWDIPGHPGHRPQDNPVPPGTSRYPSRTSQSHSWGTFNALFPFLFFLTYCFYPI